MDVRRTLITVLPLTFALFGSACGSESSSESRSSSATTTSGASAPQTSNDAVAAGGDDGAGDVTSATSPLQPGHRFVGDVDGVGTATLLVSRPGDSLTATFDLAATNSCAARTVELGPYAIEDGVASSATAPGGVTTVEVAGMHLEGRLTLPETPDGCAAVEATWSATNQGSTVG